MASSHVLVEALRTLREQFKLDEFRPGQQQVIGHLLDGRSAAAVFPTGGGKSLCYQLPAVRLPGLTLVVSPLIALMKDQIDALAGRGIAAGRLDSTLSGDDYQAVMDNARAGRLKLLYVAPERFNNERFRESIRRLKVSLFAVDEAHCISEWGHNFRPDYLKLPHFAKFCGAERMLALTATATPAVLADICRELGIAAECAIRTPFYRDNLTVLTTPVNSAERERLLEQQLRSRVRGPTIVYVTLQKTAEEVAAGLAARGFEARPYHAGMEDDERHQVQDWFMADDQGIVVATIAFGMGIDKANIRYVYHFNPPKSLENYVQEIGRAGRDGRPSTCQMLFCAADLNVLENFIYGDTPTLDAVRGLVREVLALGEAFDVSIYELSTAHDIRLLVVRTLLTYLELQGYLEGGTPFYSTYSFKPSTSSSAILAQFEGERRDFLANMFRQAVKGRTWLKLDVDRAAATIHCDRERIVRALDYLQERKLLEVKAEGTRLRYRRLRVPEDQEALAGSLVELMQVREQREIGRLQQVVALVRHDGCQVSLLGEHFGEPAIARCGHCSRCLSEPALSKMPEQRPAEIDERIWNEASALRRTEGELADARNLARFVCGITSPALVRAKLTKHALFGSLSHVPFQEILRRVDRSGQRSPAGVSD